MLVVLTAHGRVLAMARLIGPLVTVALLACALSMAGCAKELPPPAEAIQSVLELRSENSTDVAEYARYFEQSELASALAEDAATRQDKSPVPEWETPTVKSSTDTSAVVVVTWKRSSASRATTPSSMMKPSSFSISP